MDNKSLKIFFVYFLACMIWGSTWLAIRIGLESFTPMFSAGLRFAIASIIILVLMQIKKLKIQKDKISIRLYLMMAFFSFIIPFSLVYWAEQFVPSGLAAVLFAVFPFFVAFFSYVMISRDTLDRYKILGMVIGFTGVIIIFSDSFSFDFSDYFLGMSAIVLSGIIQAVVTVQLKKHGNHLNPLSMNLVPMLIAGIVLIPFGLLFENSSRLRFDAAGLLSVTYLAVFGSIIAFTSYYWLLKRISAVILSLLTFITPPLALFFGWLFYNEMFTTRNLVGCIFVLSGIIAANFNSLKKQIKFRSIKPLK
ncbi:MAG: EamA family transporter [Ignavibacteriaceae bacterium]